MNLTFDMGTKMVVVLFSGVNLLLAIVLFSTIVGDMLPVTNWYITCLHYFQVQLIFLRWIPWFLRMSRTGEKITRKTIMKQKKMKEMEQNEISSKSLLANVLDIEDDFRGKNQPYMQSIHPSHFKPPILKKVKL